MIEQLFKQLDDFGAAHMSMTGSDEDDQPVSFVVVSKDPQTIKDIKAMLDAYDDQDPRIMAVLGPSVFETSTKEN